MHFGEIRAFSLLAILLAAGIMLADRLAPAGMSRPGEAMSTAITAAERHANEARSREEGAAAARESQAMINTTEAASDPLTTTIVASGHACPSVRRVVPISGGNGIYRVTCAGANGDVSYRIDTRRGGTTLEAGPIA